MGQRVERWTPREEVPNARKANEEAFARPLLRAMARRLQMPKRKRRVPAVTEDPFPYGAGLLGSRFTPAVAREVTCER